MTTAPSASRPSRICTVPASTSGGSSTWHATTTQPRARRETARSDLTECRPASFLSLRPRRVDSSLRRSVSSSRLLARRRPPVRVRAACVLVLLTRSTKFWARRGSYNLQDPTEPVLNGLSGLLGRPRDSDHAAELDDREQRASRQGEVAVRICRGHVLREDLHEPQHRERRPNQVEDLERGWSRDLRRE